MVSKELASPNPFPIDPIALGAVAKQKVEAGSMCHGKVLSAHDQEINKQQRV